MGIKWRVTLLSSRSVTVSRKRKTVSEVQLSDIRRFLVLIEVQAGLIEYSLSSVYSFHIAPEKGIKGLLNTKRGLLSRLQENLLRIDSWVKENKGKLSESEVTIARSMYATTKELQVIVEDQIDRLKELAAWEKEAFNLTVAGLEAEDELPF